MTSKPDDSFAMLDSNILIYAEQEEEVHHQAAKSLRDRALTGEIAACITPQVLNEFFAVVTNTRRPRVSHPLTVEEAKDQIKKYCESEELAVIFPSPNVIQRVLSLLDVHPVSGQDIHDLYLAATMLENDVYRIYTYNTTDFAPISEVEVLNPDEIEIPGAEKPDSQDQE